MPVTSKTVGSFLKYVIAFDAVSTINSSVNRFGPTNKKKTKWLRRGVGVFNGIRILPTRGKKRTVVCTYVDARVCRTRLDIVSWCIFDVKPSRP